MEFGNSTFLEDAVETCHTFWRLGWAENHAGNLSYLLSREEEAQFTVETLPRRIECGPLPEEIRGRCLLVTRTGAFFRKIKKTPTRDLGILRVGADGCGLEIVWGFEDGGLPTSELPAHLLCHAARLRANPNNRVVLHCHPTYTVAMTFRESFDESSFTKALWRLNSECILVFPEGLGMLPWMVCGGGEIGPATAKKMESFRVVVWPYHGVFAAGESLDEAVGLIETIEKNALVYMANDGHSTHGISDAQLKALAEAFSLVPRAGILGADAC